MSRLAQIEAFVLIAKLGSFAAAARKLGISPAAISKQLSRLEGELGIQLIQRTTRHLELTDTGTSYRAQCERILEEVEAANALVSQTKSAPHGNLEVVCGRHFGLSFVVPHLPEFLDTYPDVHLNLELAERMPDLEAEAVDVLLGMSISATGRTIQRRVATTRYVFCAAPKYLDMYGTPQTPEELAKHRYITHSMRRPDNVLELHKGATLSVDPYLRVNDVSTMLRLAAKGSGIIMVHHYSAQDRLQQGLLIEVLEGYGMTDVPIYVAYPERRFVPAKVRCFIDFIVSKIST